MKFSEIINQDKPVLVDFFAEWCGPCKVQALMLSELKERVGEKASIIKIDVDKNPQVAAQSAVRRVPTLTLFRQGDIKSRQSGVVPTDELERLIQQNI